VDKVFELSIPFTVEKASEDNKPLQITGYANTTGKDRQGDVIVQEAWQKGGLDNYSKNPIILAFHNHSKPIGKAISVSVDKNGLKIVAEISASATEVYNLIKEGILKAFSVGFRVKEADYDKLTDIFVIKDVELYEVSVVSVPANQDSLFDVSKCFNNPAEFAEFKKSFSKADPVVTNKKEKFTMDKEVLDQLTVTIGEAAAKAAQDAVAAADKKKADEAAAQAAADKARDEMIQLGQTGAEKLVAEVEKRITDDVTDLKKTIGELTAAIKEQAEQVNAVANARRTPGVDFSDNKGGAEPTMAEKASAVILAKSLGVNVKDTKYAGKLVEKYGVHVASAFWEDQVTTQMVEEIRRQLVVASLFTNMNMPSNILRMPVNPEAGYSTWVLSTDYGTTSSSGTAKTHTLKELTLTAYKLATKEFLTYEEEDDTFLAIMPIVQAAIVRRQAKSIDLAHLRGAASGVDPIKGIATWATAGDAVTITATTKVTVAQLQAVRRKMGVWGLNPSDLKYLVSTDAYYDLLDDTTFTTMDKVGPNATILTGQIGSCNGSPVIVSGEFATKGATECGVVCINTANFITGNYKSLRLENAVDIEKQQKLLVATQRLAFQQLTSVNGNAVGKYIYS